MSNEMKMTTERLVDVFEQLLHIAPKEMTCRRKKDIYAHCIQKQVDSGLKVPEMSPRAMCKSCQALWHLQLGKKAWVQVAMSEHPGWNPVEMIPDDEFLAFETIVAGTKTR